MRKDVAKNTLVVSPKKAVEYAGLIHHTQAVLKDVHWINPYWGKERGFRCQAKVLPDGYLRVVHYQCTPEGTDLISSQESSILKICVKTIGGSQKIAKTLALARCSDPPRRTTTWLAHLGRKKDVVQLNPEVLKDWAGVDVVAGRIHRVVDGEEIWENAPELRPEYERLRALAYLLLRLDRELRHMLEQYGHVRLRPITGCAN